MLLLQSLVLLALNAGHAWALGAGISAQADDLFARVGAYLTKDRGLTASCAPFFIASHGASVEWMGCSEGNPQLKTSAMLPLPTGVPDYHEIFKTITHCPGIEVPNRRQQFSAPAHPVTCTVSGELTDNLILAENIKFNTLTLRHHKEAGYGIIASLGDVRGEGAIITSSDLLIIAGGDVSIASISTSTSERVKVTILSAQGAIEVLNADAQVSLLLIGPQRLAAPTTRTTQGYPLPQFRPLAVRGIVPKSRLP
jgi:hypothetical protein